jgi:hypothetical protein
MRHRNEPDEDDLNVHITSAEELKQMKESASDSPDLDNLNSSLNESTSSNTPALINKTEMIPSKLIEPIKSVNGPSTNGGKQNGASNRGTSNNGSKNKASTAAKPIVSLPVEAVEFAVDRISEFIDFKQNNDLDNVDTSIIGDDKWTKFYEWFYSACQ